MEISGVKSHVVAGTIVLLICDVFGARPAADVKWFNGSTPVDEKLFESEPDDDRNGTFTTRSSLKFTASRYENGKTFHCYAENAVTRGNKEPALHGNLILEVLYPPVISVSPTNITVLESNNSFLQCNYVANPQELQGVLWTKDGKNITLDNRFEGGSIRHPPLRIKNISREDRGEYVCWLKNAVGIGKSDETLLLNVLYPPNVEVIMDPSTPVKAVDRVNVTLYCNVTLGNPSNLTKVRWFLGGDVLKELPECNYTMDDDGGSFCSIDPSILYLEKSQESFAGNYTCQGMNTAGWGPESEPQELIVYYPPSPAKLRYYPSKVIKKASVTLECSVDNPGRPSNISYAWYRGSHLMNDITTSNYTISPVTLETRSNFTCIAVNEGGQSLPATNSINVDAPPSFIQNLPPYQGILSTSKNISLTCRVECWPICSILWLKDGRRLDTNNNPLYHVNTNVYKSELRKNDFESVESTLVWNMTAWPGKELDRSAPNSNYTCQSDGNVVGLGVNSTTEIAVDYAPEEVRILYQNANTSENISVIEGQSPDPVKCVGKGHPALTFVWTKKDSKEPPIKSDQLQLPPLSRHDPGDYVCLASNKHGNETLNVHFNVQYIPECTITKNNDKTTPALVCTSTANPQEVSFTWKIQEQNDTAVESVNIIQDDQQCYLYLDTNINVARTYYCFVNNSVGTSSSCEIKVDASMSWVDEIKENNKTIIIVGASIALILCFLVLCIIIIILCRRKRENTKYNSPLEMEEREKPDGQSPDTSGPNWPIKPGVLINFNNLPNLTPIEGNISPKTLNDKYKKNRPKLYAGLERLKTLLGFNGYDYVPAGLTEGPGGVVTYKKVVASPASVQPVNSRKRKKPGQAPNQSSMTDKARLGAAPPIGYTADPSQDPNRGFYENLPFHSMQNPPNKPISVIAPFTQGHGHNVSLSTKSLLPLQSAYPSPFSSVQNLSMQRNQSFSGYTKSIPSSMANINPGFNFSQSQRFMFPSQHNWQNSLKHPQHSQNRPRLPTIFYNLPNTFEFHTGNNTFSGISNNRSKASGGNQGVPRFLNLSQQSINPSSNPFSVTSEPKRITGRRNSSDNSIRRTKSGIDISNYQHVEENETPSKLEGCEKSSTQMSPEQKFGSLEMRKHKCYSPTFYSMRCKKHAKKRPLVYALPKKAFSQTQLSQIRREIDDGNLPQERTNSNGTRDDKKKLPIPAPRCRKHRRSDIIYQNISERLKTHPLAHSSDISPDKVIRNVSITKVEIHKPDEVDSPHKDIEKPVKQETTTAVLPTDPNDNENFSPSITSDTRPKLVGLSPKQPSSAFKTSLSNQNFPTMKVSPSVIKQNTEVEKGALSIQLQSKMKSSPNSSHSPQTQPETNRIPLVPKMPLLDTKTKRSSNNNDSNSQNAFYTLTASHPKQTSVSLTTQYAATIPHPKHTKLIPRALFQDHQLPKSKSFSTKAKQKKHFQIPLQKCHSFKFQTAESYFQPIKNLHEENLMKNGYVSDYAGGRHHGRQNKREKHKQKTNGPLVLARSSDYQDSLDFQENVQNCVQLQYPQPMLTRNSHNSTNKPNGVVYADLDMPKTNKKSSHSKSSSKHNPQKLKPKTEYATLKFNDIGQEIDV